MELRTTDTHELEALIECAVAAFQADERLSGGWLEGSFAEGTAGA
jgi:hypothetical protein